MNMRKQIQVSWRTIFLFLLVWFIGASILLDFWPIVRSEGDWKTVTNMEYGFSVDYPTKWKARTYGEHGFKGGDEIKLRVYRSLMGAFVITVQYQAMPDPTLLDAVSWGKSEIDNSISNLTARGEQPNYESIRLEEDVVNGYTVMRQTYKLGSVMYENVYIARTNDIIIISLQAEPSQFDGYLEDFNAIVSSFRPLD
jgi:hypothetical protein